MKTLAFVNLKGGSGKTTSCLTIGSQLALEGHSVLLMDTDPQASLTLNAGMNTVEHGTASLYKGADAARVVQATAQDDLDIVAADRSLVSLEERSAAALSQSVQDFREDVEDFYDFLLIDPPPHAGAFVLSALLTADEVIAPVQAGRGALEGLNDTIHLIKQIGGSPITGTFVCQVDIRTIHDTETVEYLQEQYGDLAFETFIRTTVTVREAEMAQEPLPLYDDSCTAAQDYKQLTHELLQRYE